MRKNFNQLSIYLVYLMMVVMQIGDNDEVMYLAAKSDKERNDWMEVFRRGTVRYITLIAR